MKNILLKSILIVLSSLLIANCTFADDKDDANRKEIFNNTKSLLISSDSYQATGFINSLGEPDSVAEYYSFLVERFYWQEKNLPNVIILAQGGIHYCLLKSAELRMDQPEQAMKLKKKARVISYNLASFCWPGWVEEGINIGHENIITGLDAAMLNIRLVKELNEGNLEHAYAYWIYGAQLLALQKYDEAIGAFRLSGEYAADENDRLNKLLAEGYVAITKIASGDSDGRKLLGDTIEALNKMDNDDARYFIGQFNTALGVFIK